MTTFHLTVLELLLMRGATLKESETFCQRFHPTENDLPNVEEAISPLVFAMMAESRSDGVLQFLIKTFPSACKYPGDSDLFMRRLLIGRSRNLEDYRAIHDIHPVSESIVIFAIQTQGIDSAIIEFLLESRPAGMTQVQAITVCGDYATAPSEPQSALDTLLRLPFSVETLSLNNIPWDEELWAQLVTVLSESGIKSVSMRVGGDIGDEISNHNFARGGLEMALSSKGETNMLESLELFFVLYAEC